mgnify:CR=1 FL=1
MLQIGQQVDGRYEIVDIIAIGGEGTIAQALDRQSGAVVVVKVLDAQAGTPGYKERAERFARAGRLRIGHPSVVDPIALGDDNGRPYMVMPFVEGYRLDGYVQRHGGRLKLDVALRVAGDVAESLDAIHAKGVIHRDLKPENILIANSGSVFLIDFGICRQTREPAITVVNGILGTPSWMSPEQAADPRSVDARSDLHAFGAVLYFLLTGIAPFEGVDQAVVLDAVRNTTPPPPRQFDLSIPVHIDACCMQLLAKRPEHRPQSAAEVLGVLRGTAPSQAASSFCRACGTRKGDAARFCCNCGAEMRSNGTIQPDCLACGGPAGDTLTCTSCGRQFSSHDHRLTIIVGTLTGKVLRIPEGWHDVGRQELGIRDQQVSQKHLRAVCLDGMLHIMDLGSTNKTYVGKELAARPILLTPGVEVRFASNLAVYSSN